MLIPELSAAATAAGQRLRGEFDAIPDHDDRPLILAGCGPLGRRSAAALAAHGRAPLAFIDNNNVLWHTEIDGVPVLPPHEAMTLYGDSAIFVVTIYNGAAIRTQLRALGAVYVLHFRALYYSFPQFLLPWCALETPDIIAHAEAEIEQAATLWADTRSHTEYAAQLAWHLGLETLPLPPHDPPGDCYFSGDFAAAAPDLCFVDCGAFDGDTLRALLRRTPEFGAYLGIEPDPLNFARLRDFAFTLPLALQDRIGLKHFALGAAPGRLRFAAAGNVASSLSETGDFDTELRTLDVLMQDRKAGFIKMDIEGAECAALRGAAEILRRDKPVLAISAYHHLADLWQIPLLIHAIEPSYALYLRRYAEDCWETVCYAIPPSRQDMTP
jgi:FkbM family methyltransferase